MKVSFKIDKSETTTLSGKLDTSRSIFSKVAEFFSGVSISIQQDGKIGASWIDDKGHKLDTKDESMQKATDLKHLLL